MANNWHNQYTVSIEFKDGFKSSRDLIDYGELEKYFLFGVDWSNVKEFSVTYNPILHPES